MFIRVVEAFQMRWINRGTYSSFAIGSHSGSRAPFGLEDILIHRASDIYRRLQ